MLLSLPSMPAGCAILSMDNYNDGSRVIDSNFDGEFLTLHPQISAHMMPCLSPKCLAFIFIVLQLISNMMR